MIQVCEKSVEREADQAQVEKEKARGGRGNGGGVRPHIKEVKGRPMELLREEVMETATPAPERHY